MAPVGSCDFVSKDDPCLINDFNDDLAQRFLTDLLDASGIQYLSPENYVIELTTFVLLNCDVDIMSQFHSLLVLLTGRRINLSFDQRYPLASVWKLLKAINVADFKIECTGCSSLSRCNCVNQTFHHDNEIEIQITDEAPQPSTGEEQFPICSMAVESGTSNVIMKPKSESKSTHSPFHFQDERVTDGRQTPPSHVRRLIGKFEALSQPGGRPPDV